MITAQMVHEAFNAATQEAWHKDWSDVSDAAKGRYEVMAAFLNARSAAPEGTVCLRRASDAAAIYCAIADCLQSASYSCFPATGQTKIVLCERHAREADPALQREVQS